MNIADYRREYTSGGLSRADLHESPFEQFEQWFKQVCAVERLYDANAMTLATVSSEGKPTVRTVLLKSFDEQGFVFFTNYTSQKAQQIEANPKVALLFPWTELDRQIEITGVAHRVSQMDNDEYILSRPRGSQLGAWASKQSSVIENRSVLDQRLDNLDQKYAERDIPVPDFWGGYCVVPETIEFWQGRVNRLHDRFEYKNTSDGWLINRLSP